MAEVRIKEHSSPIKTPKQLIVVIVLCFLATVLGIVMIAKLVTGGMKIDLKSTAMSEEAVAKRLKPVGDVVIAEAGVPLPPAATKSTAPKSAVTTAGPAQTTTAGAKVVTAAAKPAGGAADGKKTYDAACAMCHAAGVAGAPKTGDKAAWKARIAQGKDVLYSSAIKGKNLMPPKGGAASLPDADIKAAVDYLLSQAK
ncbi:MAG TPA: c-type cytochrome [Burkholderiales bacterium]|nr:c-type cytochrome [Burkholderiales bacterium]